MLNPASAWATKALKLTSDQVSRNCQTDESFYVVNLQDVCDKYIRWLQLLPYVRPFYAVKCNTDRVLVQLLAHLGVGFDCASKNEIELVSELGVGPERIVYANPCKQISHLKYSKSKGVHRMTFDCVGELIKIKKIYEDSNGDDTAPVPELIVRISTEDSDAACRLSNKFGANVQNAKILMKQATEMGLCIRGVSFHVGSGQRNALAFETPIRDASELFLFGRNYLGLTTMNLLDVGGGYPGSLNTSDTRLFNEQAGVINESYKKYFGNIDGVSVIAEPGRYFATSAYTLATPIISRKDSGRVPSYYVSESAYGSFNCLLNAHCALKTPTILPRIDGTQPALPLVKSTIWGSTCDGLDKIMDGVLLPRLEANVDWLVWEDMGAYTLSGSVNFNGLTMGRPVVYYASSPVWEEIRSAFDDKVSSKFKLVSSTEDLSDCPQPNTPEISFIDDSDLQCAAEVQDLTLNEQTESNTLTAAGRS